MEALAEDLEGLEAPEEHLEVLEKDVVVLEEDLEEDLEVREDLKSIWNSSSIHSGITEIRYSGTSDFQNS